MFEMLAFRFLRMHPHPVSPEWTLLSIPGVRKGLLLALGDLQALLGPGLVGWSYLSLWYSLEPAFSLRSPGQIPLLWISASGRGDTTSVFSSAWPQVWESGSALCGSVSETGRLDCVSNLEENTLEDDAKG